MSIYAVLDADEPDHLASNQGWGDFGAWADKLDHERYGEVVRLWEHGQCTDLEALGQQLQTALHRDPPPAEDVRTTAKALLSLLAERGGADVLTVSNGMTAAGEGES